MSPGGIALAVLLHALVAFLLWWMSHDRPPIPLTEDVVEVSFDLPKPPEPPPPAPAPTPEPKVATAPPPPVEGIRPPAELTSEKPTQVRPTAQNPTNENIPLSAQQSLEKAIPTPEPEPPPPTSLAFATPKPEPAPPPPTPQPVAKPEPPPPAPPPTPKPPDQALEKAIPKPEPEPPPPATSAFAPPKPPPPPPPKPEAKPQPKPQQQATIAVPPANPNPRPAPAPYQPRPSIAPSPLSRLPQQQRPSATTRGADAPQTSSFVNPADTYNKARVADNYLWEVVRRLQGYEYFANVSVAESVTVVAITIARDGRLLNVAISRSSGYPEMDNGVVAGVRAGSPYTPLPDNIQGASATFTLPLVSRRGR